jgi:drug/metabolite transporter (DMT)-like permease
MHTNAGDAPTPGPSAALPRPGVWLTDVTLVLMALIWGVNFVVIKFATTVLPIVAFNAVRVSLAAVALLIAAVAGRGPWPTRRQTLSLIGLGVLGNGIYQMLFVQGVAHTRASDAAILIAATPVFIAVLGRIGATEHVHRKVWGGILLSIVGIGLISSAGAAGQSQSSLYGDLLVLGGSFCWAVYTVLLKPHTHAVDGIKLGALTMIGGAAALMLFAWPAVLSAPWRSAPPSAWWAILYSGIGSLVIAYLFWYRGVRVIGPTRTAMYSNIQPVFAVLAAWIVLGELPTLWQGVGAASIMSGLLLTRS